MAKQCIYCGRPLAKDDARFCNDCGRLQVAAINPASDAVAPSAIKVKLPPKEYTSRDDLPSTQQEASLPGPVASSSSIVPSSRGQMASPPSTRLPKRPTRLKPQTSSVAEDQARAADSLPVAEAPPLHEVSSVVEDQAKPVGSAHAAELRPPVVVPASQPTPAEEASTMVLPNWREELAQLRKEQEQARIDASSASAKKAERAVNEPPPLPRRSAGTFPPPGDVSRVTSPRREPNTPLPSVSEDEHAFEAPRQIPQTPQPQHSARPAQNTALPPSEKKPPTEVSRRELRVKVWEPEATVRSTPAPVEKREATPIPAIEQNPFASAAFDAEEQLSEGEALENITWQAPREPFPASRKQLLDEEEKQPLAAREESQSPAREEKPYSSAKNKSQSPVSAEKPSAFVSKEGQLSAGEEQPALAEDRRQPGRGERPQPTREEIHPLLVDDESDQQAVMEGEEDIEDLPTVPLAVPELVQQEPSIKIERTSTPAPKKWAVPRPGNVEDLPTRPMVASSSVSAPARAPQRSSQAQSSETDQVDGSSPSAQRIAQPSSLPGAYGQAPTAQAGTQVVETDVEPMASRARSPHTPSQPGISFDPASLPPLPAGSLPTPGNVRPRAEAQRAQGSQARAATAFPDMPDQRPPVFASSAMSVSSTANTSKPTADTNVTREKEPRKRRHTRSLVITIVLVLVLVGGGIGVALNRDWVMQYFQAPAQSQPYQAYQNSALGFSVDYTQGWTASVDQAQSTVHFADSSHTGQANLTRATASGQVSDYLNQQVIHLGITASKAAPSATMGGASWQVVQGTVALSGATYTVVLYATQHTGHFYLLELLAPQSSFTHTEQSDFAHMRSSFQFL